MLREPVTRVLEKHFAASWSPDIWLHKYSVLKPGVKLDSDCLHSVNVWAEIYPAMPSYKLIYFNVRGRAEQIRMLFVQAGVQYEDVRLTGEQWGEMKASKC